MIVSALLAALLAYVQSKVIASTVVLAWLLLVLLVTLSRAILVIAYQRSPVDDNSTARARLAKFRLGVLVAGAVWGSAGFLFFPANDPQHQMFLILMLAGLTAGGVVSYAGDLVCAIGFSLLALLPIIIHLLIMDDGLYASMGMAGMLYLGFMIMTIRNANQSISEIIVLRLDAVAHEETLRASEEALRESQAIAALGSYILDISTGIWESTDVLDKLLGIDKTYIRSVDGWGALIHPDDRMMMDNYFKNEVLKESKPFNKEYRVVRHNDQTVRWVHGLGKLEFNAQGFPLKLRGTIQDITAGKLVEAEMRKLAFYDSLTLLPNRRLLMDRLHHAMISSGRIGRTGALLFIDLDNFKSLNDTLGHGIGDLLLKQVAQRLLSCVRDDDTVSRLGGDEFVVMLENLSAVLDEAAAQTEVIGEKILAAINMPYQLHMHEHRNTASIGVTLFAGNQQAVDELMKQADIAMYQSKKAGRNTLRFFDPEMQASITSRFSMEGELRKALENREFELHYQVQMDILNRPVGAEVLIRWRHPLRGMISPAHFIPLAEDTGLIIPIGAWVLETACAQIKSWEQDALTRDLILAVNVSARQFHQADFVAQVQAAVQRHDIGPSRLKLELTESMLVEDVEQIIAIMNKLNDVGIQFSMDDFGTGYSSLQYLKRLPLDQLKIDMSFVRDLGIVDGANSIVQTIIAMARGLKLDVIAEGVETVAQHEILSFYGCHHYQGYLLGKPVPIEQFEASLKQGR